MKRTLSSDVVIYLLLALLTACGGGGGENSDSPVNSSSGQLSQSVTSSSQALSVASSNASVISSTSSYSRMLSSSLSLSVMSSSFSSSSSSSSSSSVSSSLSSGISSSLSSSVFVSSMSSVATSSSSAGNLSSVRQVKKSINYSNGSSTVRIRFLEYTPEDYATATTKKYPLLVFAHGSGERSQNDDPSADATEYARIMVNGPPKHINQNHNMCFTVEGVESCFIVISPQSPQVSSWWSVEHIRAVFDYAKTNLRVDTSRIYMTGLSMGGGITWAYARSQRSIPKNVYAAELAAIVPIAGADQVSNAACNMSKEAIPVWAFHGTEDRSVSIDRSREFVDAINGIHINKTINTTAVNVQCTANPQAALLTEFAGVGHDSWSTTYNPNNRFSLSTKQLDSSGVNIYEWLLSHKRPNAELLKNGERVISPGTYQTLGVSNVGLPYAWGSNRAGQLGVGNNDVGIKYSTPQLNTAIDDELVAFSAGGYQGMALNRGGRVYTFGVNDTGQRGNGAISTDNDGAPYLVNGLHKVVAISSGARHNLALTSAGKVFAWGMNENGQVGASPINTTTTGCSGAIGGVASQYHVTSPYEVPIPTKVSQISAGYCFNLALDENGEVWSWGFGDYLAAALGHGNQTYQSLRTPTKISTLSNIVGIAAGEGCAYAVNNQGQIWAWGINRLGCVGDGTTNIISSPKMLAITDVKKVVARAAGAYALTNSGQLWSWGETMYGSVGNGTYVNLPLLTDSNRLLQSSPVQITSLGNVRDVMTGSSSNHVFVQLTNGEIWTWGRNKSGNLGNGEIGDADSTNQTPDDKNKPSPVKIVF